MTQNNYMPRRGRSKLTDETFFFVTTTIVKFQPIFIDKMCCEILIENIKFYQKRFKFVILGYVIMPTHFHWAVITNPTYGSISDIMRDIKKFSAWQIFDLLEQKCLHKYLDIFKYAARSKKDQNRKFWKERFDDRIITSDGMLWSIINYMHENPLRAGLVEKAEEYVFSSARNYLLNDHTVIQVDTDYCDALAK